MRVEFVPKENIESIFKGLDNCIIYYFDRLVFGKCRTETVVNLDDIYEAFFFKPGICLHVYREDGLKSVLYTEEEDDEAISETQLVRRGLKPCNSGNIESIVIKKYIKEDEDDGMMFICRTLPSDLILAKKEAYVHD